MVPLGETSVKQALWQLSSINRIEDDAGSPLSLVLGANVDRLLIMPDIECAKWRVEHHAPVPRAREGSNSMGNSKDPPGATPEA